jgi:monoamine oxidase
VKNKIITRRNFITTTAAGISACALPLQAAKLLTAKKTIKTRVAIIGGGLAGLTTARNLERLGITDVVILEARSRVGGRTLNLRSPQGHHLESGGEWTGPGQDRVQALATELGISQFPCYYKGDAIFELGNTTHKGLVPRVGLGDSKDFISAALRLHHLGKSVPVENAWLAHNAKLLDQQTLADWLIANVPNRAVHGIFSRFTRAVFTSYPHHISLLWYLFYMNSCGGLWSLMRMEGGAQDSRFDGGSQEISIRMANALKANVMFGEPTKEIIDRPGSPVIVKTSSANILCERVVVAMSPADANRIDFTDCLEPERKELMASWANTPKLPALKVAVVYKSPFWRKKGLSGHIMGDTPPVQLTFDNSPKSGEVGVISLFLSLIEAKGLTDKKVRKKAIITGLAKRLGPEGARPIYYTEKDWARDLWSTGCVLPLKPDVLHRVGHTLRKASGRIHWAGTETSPVWCGYMDGAVRSGERCAVELHKAIT